MGFLMGALTVKLNPKAEKELAEFFKGVVAEAGYFDGQDHGDGETIASIAAENELERPFMSRAASDLEKEVDKFFEKEAKKKGFNMKVVFGKIGELARTFIIKQIDTAKEWAKPNSPYTIFLKGSSQPLTDTSVMRNNTDFRVKE